MSTKWTKDQQKVIDLRNRNLLVSAAAGSGKTAVLIERILARILDQEQPIDIDRLLVVTFTRAAAGEMRERLNTAIEKKLETEESEHLSRQLTLLQNAQITTIDSFCAYLLKNYFHMIGLDPNYRVMDEGESKLLKGETVGELLEEQFAEGDEAFLRFVECFATGKNDQILEESILRLYEFAMSYPYPREWLQESLCVYKTGEGLFDQPWVQEILQAAQKRFFDLKKLCRKAIQIAGEPGGPSMYLDALLSDETFLAELSGAENYLALFHCFEQHKGWMRLSSKKDEQVQEEKKSFVKAIRDEVKAGVDAIREQFFSEEPFRIVSDMEALREPISVLVELTCAFMDRFGEKKRRQNLLDFHDMEHLALSILRKREEGRDEPTDTAKELAEQFEEIMIDEYQDSNLVQEAILTAVSRQYRGENNLFMVGDVKQSIYRFRLARPELFLEKYHTYTKEESNNQRIDLSQNFRSRREVLAFTNEIFQELMGKNLGSLVYDKEAALYPGADYPQGGKDEFLPELLFLDLDRSPELVEAANETVSELSARLTGQKILSMVGKEEIFDKELGKMRKMEFRDIVLLFRSPSSFTESYGKILGDMGIPTYTGSQSGYFSAREIQVVLSLLQIIDNPRQDIPLAAVLSSSIAGLSPGELAEIKSGAPDTSSFYESVKAYMEEGEQTALREKLSDFFGMLNDFRAHVPYLPIHELLWYIFDVTWYEQAVSAMPAGEQRAMNLKMLVQKAWDYEKTNYRGLFNFIRYIENLQKYDVDYGEAGLLGDEKNVVRILSIHKSKGLEFPVVFLCGLEKLFNRQDTQSRLVLDVDLGIGSDFVDPDLRIRRSTLFKRWMQQKVREDNLSEELRILYVALTRAKEKLILTAVVKDLEKKTNLWYAYTDVEKKGLTYSQLVGARGYLDFLMPVLLKKQSALPFLHEMGLTDRGVSLETDPVWDTPFVIRVMDIQELLVQELKSQTGDEIARSYLEHFDTEKVYETEAAGVLKERLEGAYPFEESGRIPVKLTVSELKRQSEQFESSGDGENLFEKPEEEIEVLVPEFLKKEENVQGAARGTAYHTALQYLDFTAALNVQAVKDQITELQSLGRLTAEEAAVVDARKLCRLALSELGRRMAAAQEKGDLLREQHFVYARPGKEIYPEANLTRELLIQGVIDACFLEDGEWVLVDYKTDFTEPGGERALYEKYAAQLDYYEQALSQLTGQSVKEKILYSLFLQKELREN